MNIFKWLFTKKPVEKWSLVETICIKNQIQAGGVETPKKKRKHVYIYLFESEFGKRRFTSHCNTPDGYRGTVSQLEKCLYEFVPSMEIYRTRIKRWLLGRRDPKIPSYNDVADVEHAEMLQGAINPALEESDFTEEQLIQ